MEGSLKRVLLVERGTLASRSIEVWRGLGIETVLAFGTEDAECDWLDEADYAVWYGSEVGKIEPERLISAAMDAGCEGIDPGPLSDDIDLLDLALKSNLAVVGCDLHRSAKYRDAEWVAERASELGVPAAPSDGVGLRRRMDVWILIDQKGGSVAVGPVEYTVAASADEPWLVEHGQVPAPAARDTLTEFSLKLAQAVGGPGILRVQWGWFDGKTWALTGLRTSVGPGWPLLGAVHHVDAVWARINSWLGGGGNQASLAAERHGVLGNVVATEAGTIESIEVPEGAMSEVEAGDAVTVGQVLAKVYASAPTRQSALVKLGSDLEQVRIEGVANGLETLRGIVGDRDLWEGRLDAQAALERLKR